MAKEDKRLSIYTRIVPDMKIEYDDIVDRSHFVTTAEQKRGANVGKVGAGEVGQYDYEAGEQINDSDRISDLELLARSGKLDKADVQTLKDIRQEEFESERDKRLLEEQDKANRTRQGKLDKILGIDEDSENKSDS